MKEELNLNGLKHSKNPKHRKIAEKAQRLIEKDWETEELSEEQILEIANGYDTLKVKVLVNGDVCIRSKKDNWYVRDEFSFYSLYHKGTFIDRGKIKDRYHIQDIFYDLDYLFASIVSHDDFRIKSMDRGNKDILDIIDKSSKNRRLAKTV